MTTTPPNATQRPRIISAERSDLVRNRLIESRLTPNAISLTGLVLCLIAAALVYADELFLGGVAFVIGSVCDMLDGKYSRMSGKASPFGAFLDSTLDRIEEGVMLTVIAASFAGAATATDDNRLIVGVVGIAIVSSIMVSYTRARAEALGVECKVGFGNRAGRVIILSAGLLLADLGVLEPAIYLLAVLSTVTVFQRIFHVRKQLIAGPPAV
ncbi:MAG: CDP-alcohol phosphatidyltransferase family protein [Solirubrobacteraceae bacterium]|nr:CDP-alcohol phosphatidyltransferase family protein [Solirubrobacteraceae bacterium]